LFVRTGTSDNYDYPFKLLASGKLKAKDAEIEGKITATSGSFTGDVVANKLTANTSGSIGGWSITTNAIYRTNSSFGNANGLYFGSSGLSLTDKFKVTAAGALTATSADITGAIKATSGTFGASNASRKIQIGTNTSDASIYYGMSSLANTTNNGFYIGTDGIALGAGKFKVTAAGALTASNVTITGGSLKIGDNFTVTTTGVLTAKSGSFTGSITSSTIQTGIFSVDAKGNVTIQSSGFNVDGVTGLTIKDDSGNSVTINPYDFVIKGAGKTLTMSSSVVSASLFTGNLNGKVYSNQGEYRMPVVSSASSNAACSGIGTTSTGLTVSGQYGSSSYSSKTYAASSSDMRLKENIKDSTIHALDIIKQIRHREFDWKDGTGHYDVGYIA